MTAPALAPRVGESLNRALHRLFARDERLHLLGEDVLDPYGGAFKITRGLSTAYPDRVLATPLSEGAIVGVGAGLALCGTPAIVEIMFGDFLALAFDQLLNFASKSVSMYGTHVPVPLLVRAPVGGNRGYGPTHSQSLQKHFIGVPNLALYELSAFHDVEAVLDAVLDRGTPGILFEDKVLYTRRMCRQGRVDDLFRYRMLGGDPLGWAHLYPEDEVADPDVVVIAPGGVAHRAIDAARQLRERRRVHVLTPAQLYPLDIEPVLQLLASAGRIAVAEEATAGGTWGCEVARLVYERLWSALRGPVLLLNSADSIIPTAGHLEREVVLGADGILAALERVTGGTGCAERSTGGTGREHRVASAPSAGRCDAGVPGGEDGVPRAAAGAPGVAAGIPITTPKLNNNDESYVVVDWLVDEGAWVEARTDVVSVETSKAIEDIPSPGAGYLRRVAAAGEEKAVGSVLGYLVPRPDPPRESTVPRPDVPPEVVAVCPVRGIDASGVHRLDRVQLGTAAVVAASHRQVPAGFTVVRAEVDGVLQALARRSDETGALFGLPEVIIKAVAALHQEFPLCYGTLLDEQTVALPDAPHVGVTVDAAGALYVPVVKRAHERSLADIADLLMEFRIKSLDRRFAAHELDGGNITVSLNPDPGVLLVHPIVMWPQLCMLSVGAVGQECRIGPDGGVVSGSAVNLGLAYDHRVINGRDAVLFLSRIKTLLDEPDWLYDELRDEGRGVP